MASDLRDLFVVERIWIGLELKRTRHGILRAAVRIV